MYNLSKEIECEKINGIQLGYNKLTAEFVSILLGDGNLRRKGFRIDLNQVDEAEYVEYVKNLINRLFNKFPIEELRRDKEGRKFGKGIRLSIYGVDIIRKLLELGLEIANKVDNQVGIPTWILKIKEFCKYSLRGLFDTDGNIDIHKSWKSLTLRFVNASKPLVIHFKQICESLGIKPSNVRKIKMRRDPELYNGSLDPKVYDGWIVSIGSKENVKKFVKTIKPKKFLFRKKLIAMILIILEDPEKFEILKIEQDKKFSKEKKINRYTREYNTFLENLFVMNKWSLNKDILNNAIEKAFQLKRHKYNDEFAEKLKMLFEIYGTVDKVIEHLKNQNTTLEYHTIKNHIKKLLSKKEFISIFKKSIKNPLEIEGISFLDKWNKNNSRIIIDENEKRLLQFNSKLRLKIALEIRRILYRSQKSKNDSDDKIIQCLKEKFNQSAFLKRLSYLLTEETQSKIIIKYLKKVIEVVRMFINDPTTTSYKINKDTGLKKDAIQEIINAINNEFKY